MTTAPALVHLEIDDPPDSWRSAGFTVDERDRCAIGTVTVTLTGGAGGGGIRSWGMTEVDEATEMDGLTLDRPDAIEVDRVDHPNTAVAIDHLVVLTPDIERTVAAMTELGMEERGRRHTESYGSPMTQVFHRAGEVIVEIVGPPRQSGDEPAEFFGLAFTLADLDAPVPLMGDALGDRKPAVQEGRDRRGVRHDKLGLSVPMLFMSAGAGD